MMRVWKTASLGVLLAACGGSAPSPEPAPGPMAVSTGAEAPQASEEAEEPVTEQTSAAPGKLTIVTKLANQPVAAHVKVYGPDGGLVAEGAAGEALEVPSGDLSVEAALTDHKVLLGHETIRRDVSVEPGQEAKEQIAFERCMVRVNVRIRGKLDTTAVVTLSKDGQEIVRLRSGDADFVAIVPGRYQASVKSQRAQISVSDIALNEGATQTIPIDVD